METAKKEIRVEMDDEEEGNDGNNFHDGRTRWRDIDHTIE